ncbi:dihydrolipoamide acetyltransferase component of pyruvate dehydrogenase complex [Longispora fulva]|uniref:Dihydrolipoamide acetyltransferase component of pyruvate dehydrogenase complex n=1 Tax=Longispora fulva TaxID=619741 RepID=A0A8J7GJZ4_9ACTN|nr:dihydrolipoamide acetyltransferase family protein [Longispora fulva]MBG6137945.1 pyruvate dehydrogenase E2 component (dihydrolipoamide acetyltransferase) [Longispora fulva]GIG60198.1 dihydrolipoamide acetyltransferase component of pyruvate dehydrogenase complex [Longispora fulva]
MTSVFHLPDLGEGLTEAEILEWRVAVGDTVGIDQIVVVVETAKAAVDVPCPYAGTVLELHGAAGSVVDVGKPLITIGSPDGRVAPDTYRDEEMAGAKAPAESKGSGNVLVGYGTAEMTGRRRRRLGAGTTVNGTGTGTAVTEKVAEKRAPLVISPIVRRLAADNAVDVAALTGSGLGGIVTRRDVESAIEAARTPATVAATSVPRVAVPAGAVAAGTRRIGLLDERVPIKGQLKAMADRLSRSRREIPDATTWVDVDATGLMSAKNELAAGYPDHRVGVLALLARITVAGLLRYPQLNAQVDGDEIVRLPYVNLGFAAQTERGLVVPVIRDAHLLSTVELADEIVRLVELARAGRLGLADMTGGTFTLNNYGGYGVDGSTPIINHPEAAMLGVGRIIDKPWVVDGQLAVRKVTQMGLTFDHRVCDGGVAGGYLRYVADRVERPMLLLG